MNDYIIFMHDDATVNAATPAAWERYFARLAQSGRFAGGSAIGDGVRVTKSGTSAEVTAHLSGYIRVQAESIDEARSLLEGNPVLEGGGSVEIRLLPRG